MSTLSSIVNVNISIANQGVPQAAYNILMLLSSTKAFTPLYESFSSMKAIASTFAPNEPEYVAAQTFFSQNPTSPPLYIGRRIVDSVSVNILPVVDVAALYWVKVISGGVTYTQSYAGALAINSESITFSNVSTSALSPWDSGDVVTGTIDGVAMAPVTCTGVAATDIAAVVASMQTAGGSNINTITYSTPTTASVIIDITSSGSVAVSVTNLLVTPSGGGTWSGSISYFYTYSASLLAKGLVAAINASTMSTIVTATSSGTTITLTSVNPEISGGAPWSYSAYVTNVGNNTLSIGTSTLIFVTQAIPRATYTVTINGVAYSYQAPNTITDAAAIAQNLVTTILDSADAPDTSYATVSYNSTLQCIEVDSVNEGIAGEMIPIKVGAYPQQYASIILDMYQPPSNASTTASDVTAALTNIATQNNDWYAIACTDRTETVVNAIASYALANQKLFGSASGDPVLYSENLYQDQSSIAYQLISSGTGTRTFLMFNTDAGNNAPPNGNLAYPEMAWFGKLLSYFPGSQNWAFQNLNAVTATTGLTDTQIANVFSKNVNLYQQIKGVKITQWGTLVSGDYIWIDILQAADWIVSAIQESIYTTLISAGKVPYTNAGINTIVCQIQKVLSQAVNYQLLADNPAPSVSAPTASEVSATDKTNRVLNNVAFTAVLAGAINTVNINGTVSF